MFRYIAFCWDPTRPDHATAAGRLQQRLNAHSAWSPALDCTGLQVYTAGARAGINQVYSLPLNQGVVLGRIFRRHNQASRPACDIDLTPAEVQGIACSAGRVLIDEFWGRYVAFFASRTGEGKVLRDPTGTLPCFHLERDGVHIVFSWLEALYELLPNQLEPPVNWDAVAAHLTLGRLEGRETGLTGVEAVPPGELLTWGRGAAKPTSYWSAADIARRPHLQQPDAATAQLKEAVERCVQNWASCYPSILLRLSGGVDSSILLGCLRAARPAESITCLNYHSAGADSDERGYARLAADRAAVKLVERERDANFTLHDVLDVARTPTPSSYGGRMGTGRTDAEVAAAASAPAMFTGAGGDQLFFEIKCTWPAADYLRLRGLDGGFLKAVLDSAKLAHVSVWRAMRLAFRDRYFPAPLLAGAGAYAALVTREAIDTGIRNANRFVHPGLLAADDLPFGKLQHLRELIYPMGYYDPYLRDAAPELVNPLLSQPLLEVCLAMPTYLLTHGGRGRALARKAFADVLPREIATRRSKGGMEEHAVSVLQRSLPLARRLLLDGHLVRQGLLDSARVEAALAGSATAMHAYVSEIHNCIAVEAWLQRILAKSDGARS